MFAAIDIGNTRAKLGLFKNDKLVEVHSFENLYELKTVLDDLVIDKIIIASVKQSYDEILKVLNLKDDVLLLSSTTRLPFRNKYTSATLGIDRIALIAGAQVRYPSTKCLVIDVGTCITYDYINEQAEYLGGAISPGKEMRFKSLHNFTARLPLIEKDDYPLNEWLGNSTTTSIQSGVINGISGEIASFISQYEHKFGHMQVIITGGDAKFFESRIKATIFALPELLLVGLNAILRHNASN